MTGAPCWRRRRMMKESILVLLLLTTSSLLLTSTSEAAKTNYDPKDFLVEGLEEVEPAFGKFEGEMYAGLLPIDDWDSAEDEDSRGKLMFWLFEPENPISTDSLVIWLNGGPGCSSAIGLLLENSPVTNPLFPAGYYRLDANAPLIENEYSWTRATNMIYIEQPTGTGFSNGAEVTMEEELSRDFYNFLLHFFNTFQHLHSKKLYIFGESYAGMYVPAIARYIHLQNVEKKKSTQKEQQDLAINLEGVGIGNGWFDPYHQTPAVIDYAFWHGMIDLQQRKDFHQIWELCSQQLISDDDVPFHHFTTPDECGIMFAVLKAAGGGLFMDGKGPNTYDVTTWDPYDVVTTHNSTVFKFYNNPKVKQALHAPMDIEWSACIPGSGRRRRRYNRRQLQTTIRQRSSRSLLMLDDDKPVSVVPYIAELLDDAKIKVLIYCGDLDLSDNGPGTEKVITSMKWRGQQDWPTSQRGIWIQPSKNYPSGYMKQHKNLQFLIVYNSGHLVPMNVPAQALDMITRFITNQSFVDKEIPRITLSSAKMSAIIKNNNAANSKNIKIEMEDYSIDIDEEEEVEEEGGRKKMVVVIKNDDDNNYYYDYYFHHPFHAWIMSILIAMLSFVVGIIVTIVYYKKFANITNNNNNNNNNYTKRRRYQYEQIPN